MGKICLLTVDPQGGPLCTVHPELKFVPPLASGPVGIQRCPRGGSAAVAIRITAAIDSHNAGANRCRRYIRSAGIESIAAAGGVARVIVPESKGTCLRRIQLRISGAQSGIFTVAPGDAVTPGPGRLTALGSVGICNGVRPFCIITAIRAPVVVLEPAVF